VSHPKSLKDFGGDRAKGNSDRQNREWIKPKNVDEKQSPNQFMNSSDCQTGTHRKPR